MAHVVTSNEYRVVWEIDLTASSPEEAARMAYGIQHDPDSIANVFTVIGVDEIETIDLQAIDEARGVI